MPDAPSAERSAPDWASLDLQVGGMTCTASAARLEKKLNRVEGVQASVNYATEQASVRYDPRLVGPDDLVAVVERTGYSAQVPAPPSTDVETTATPADELAPLKQRLIISALLGAPVLLLAMVSPLQFDDWQWLCLTLASPVVVWGGWPFHRSAALNARHGAATMDTLVSLGTLAAYVWSLVALFFGDAGMPGMRMRFSWTADGRNSTYLEVASTVVVFMLLGRFLEARAKRSSGAALRALLDLGAKRASVLRGGVEQSVPVDELRAGDIFVVRPGERIATDGVVVAGSSALAGSMLTRVPLPGEVGPGDAVTGATVNAGGRLHVRATRVGADTRLAQIARLVVDAQSGKAPVQRLADRIAGVFVPIVLALATLTLVVTLAVGDDASRAFTAAVAVLIIACPCALGLATPTALLVGTGRGAQLGLLIKGPEVLETTRRIDTVVLDKTGTVTAGRMTLTATHGDPAGLRLAAAVEAGSEHPIARAIVAAVPDHPTATAFASTAGLGVQATVDEQVVTVGRGRFVQTAGLEIPLDLRAQQAQAERDGGTAVLVGWDGRVRTVLVVADTVKPTSAAAVADLRSLGLTPVLLTGDNRAAAEAVAQRVGIDEVMADVLPEDKIAAVRQLQQRGRVVAMVGDGVNDAAALAAADLGLAMGGGTDAAIEASDITLVRDDLRGGGGAHPRAPRTRATHPRHPVWGLAYKVVLIPVAAFGLLSPLVAGAAMAFSSVFVVTNSLRLRSFGRDQSPSATA
ncbi:MAG: heavy metal translocating P-type ATPase [Jatrophihabitans sp.]|uniref:heavy metal translocating P-type ATPase n=1 Tax=Jatrophihabitans sp. TaxID=1932789 RepID=UPI003F7ED1BD